MPDDNGITLAEAKLQLSKWLAADAAVSQNQSYDINNELTVTRADAGKVRENVEFWDARVRQLARGGIAVRGVTFLP